MTNPQPTNSLAELAESLEHLARMFAEAAHDGELPAPVTVHVQVTAGWAADRVKAQLDAVDRMSAIVGEPAVWERSTDTGGYYQTRACDGPLSLKVYAYGQMPDPADEVRAENEALKAKLAAIEALAASAREPEPAAALTAPAGVALPVATPEREPLTDEQIDGALLDLAEALDADPALLADEPAVEHAPSTFWTGPPGECGASCACGLTYDGFNTVGEAGKLIDAHIAAVKPGCGCIEAPAVEQDPDALDQLAVAATDPAELPEDLRTPDEWQQAYPNVQIMDPDGWRGANGRPWTDEITAEEYLWRRSMCTVTGRVDDGETLVGGEPS